MPYQNPELSPAERAKDLVKRLTLEEKALLMCDDSEAIPRLGIKKFNWWSEALHGVANQGNVTVFPEPVGMAASFNDKLVFDIFNAVSDEMRAKHNERVRNGLEDVRFHSLLSRATGNQVAMIVTDVLGQVEQHTLLKKMETLNDGACLALERRILARHREILSAIHRQDDAAAKQAMREHTRAAATDLKV